MAVRLVVVGEVVGTHGSHGAVKVRILGDGPEHLLGAREVALADSERGTEDPAPRRFEVEEGGKGRPGEVRLKLRGVCDVEAARALRGRLVVAPAAELPELPEGEFYWFQLVGCRVVRADGEEVGTVRELWDTGAHDVLVVEGADGRDRLVPTARPLLREIDLDARRIVVADDVPGLLDPA